MGSVGIIVMLVFFVGISFFVIAAFLMFSKANKLRIRDPLHEKGYIKDIPMREWVDKTTKVLYWKSLPFYPKLQIPEPPQSVTDIGKKGKKYVEAYRLSEDEFVFIDDKGIKITKDDRGKIQAYDIGEDGKTKKIDSFQPFTATQRQVLVHQFVKSDEISKKKWGVAEIMGMASMGSLVMVIMMMLLFGGDLLNEYQGARQSAEQRDDQIAEITKNLAVLTQALGVHFEGFDFEISQTVQSQGSNVINQEDETPPNVADLRGQLGLV